MTDTSTHLTDLIEISEDGYAFYEEAAQKVKDKKLSALFARMAKVKSELAQELSGEVKPVAGRRKPAKKGDSSLGDLARAYAGLRKQEPGSERFVRMAEVEGQLQTTFQKVVLDRDHSFVVRVLAKQYVSKAEVLNKELRAANRGA
jgi:uncharacterized protein (TIGR02284 family)